MSQLNRISGVVRLISAMHSGAATKTAGSGNMVGTACLWVTTPNGQIRIPILPANSKRGGLRRVGSDVVLKSFQSKGIKYPLELYGGLRRGASQARPSGEMTIGEVLRARKNVFMGLFGGGARMFESGYKVGDLVATTQTAVQIGQVPQAVIDSGAAFIPMKAKKAGEASAAAESYNCFSSVKFFKRDDLSLVSGQPELLANVENFPDAFAAYQDATLENNQARKTMKAAKLAGEATEEIKKTDMAGIFEFEVIPPGTPMYWHMDLNDALTDAQVGFLAMTVCEYANQQKMGGMSRFGFGRFNANLTIIRNGEEMPLITSDGFGKHSLSKPMEAYAELARAEIDALTVDELMSFYNDLPKKAPKIALAKAA